VFVGDELVSESLSFEAVAIPVGGQDIIEK